MIHAECVDCGDTHPLADRSMGWITTNCPSCESTQYRTIYNGSHIEKSERARIRDAINDLDGVGGQTLGNILSEYDYYAELEVASVDELTEIRLVGDATAERIVDAV